MGFKKLYCWPKKQYQLVAKLSFLAGIPTPGRVGENFTSKLRRVLNPVASEVSRLALERDICLCNITIARGYILKNHGKTNL